MTDPTPPSIEEVQLRPSAIFAPVGYPFPLRRGGVASGRLLAVSGQFGQVDFRLVGGGLEAQVRQALRNVASVVGEHRLRMSDVIKTTIYLADIDDFDRMNRVYLEFFDQDRLPARTTAGVRLPFGALVEIEAWARRPGPLRRALQTWVERRATHER